MVPSRVETYRGWLFAWGARADRGLEGRGVLQIVHRVASSSRMRFPRSIRASNPEPTFEDQALPQLVLNRFRAEGHASSFVAGVWRLKFGSSMEVGTWNLELGCFPLSRCSFNFLPLGPIHANKSDRCSQFNCRRTCLRFQFSDDLIQFRRY